MSRQAEGGIGRERDWRDMNEEERESNERVHFLSLPPTALQFLDSRD